MVGGNDTNTSKRPGNREKYGSWEKGSKDLITRLELGGGSMKPQTSWTKGARPDRQVGVKTEFRVIAAITTDKRNWSRTRQT